MMLKTRARKNTATLLVAGTLGLFTYQNCQKANFGAEAVGSEAFLRTSLLEINRGAQYTNDAGVQLRIEAPSAGEMYITNDPTCETGGAWEAYRPNRSWTLTALNNKATVYAKFKQAKDSQFLGCINASIIHDNIAPKVEILTRPGAFAKAGLANYEYRGTDNISGVERLECRVDGTLGWTACENLKAYPNMAEGNHETFVRAIDKAGNISNPLADSFAVDLTPPTLQITEKPASTGIAPTAVFKFEAEDKGSGVKVVKCALQAEGLPTKEVADCKSPVTFTDLGKKDLNLGYRFSAIAEDGAGNLSASVNYDFEITLKPSAEFNILGITGSKDSTIDAVLARGLNPTVNWSRSEGASRYSVIITEANGAVKCPAQDVSVTSISLAFSSCALVDGVSYLANVRAINSSNLTRDAAPFAFRVDASGPTIQITGPELTNDTKNAKFDFTLSDGSGIDSATCIRKTVGGTAGSTVSTNCSDLTTLSYANLALGSYTFQIEAKDKVGNTSTSQIISWNVTQVVCDPFSSTGDGVCVKGLQANLYYLSDEQRKTPFKKVDEYITKGVKANILIYLADLFVPTRNFTKGFTTTEGTTLRTNDGATLMEYFALDLQTFIKLDPANQMAGKYQFAILSDDGATVEYMSKGDTAWKPLINIDGDHSTMMGCDLKGIDFTTATRTKFRIKYYQGPKTQIALSLLWRPMPTDSSKVKDENCDYGDTSYYFGDGNAAQPDLVNGGYGKLVKRGWKPLTPANFIVDETLR
jgi:hypothetical protein